MPEETKEHRVDAGEVAKQVLAALKTEGKGENVSEQLIRENIIAREKRREAEEALETLRKTLPAKDAVILTGDDAKTWKIVTDLNVKGDDLKARVEGYETLKAKDEQRTRDDARRTAAKAAGLDPDGLSKIAGVDGLTFEVKEETVDGAKKGVAYVTPPGEKQAAVKLDEWLKSNVPAPMVAALKAGEGTGGTTYPAQSGAEQPPKSTTYDPVAAGKEMAKEQKADVKTSLAFQ